MEMATAAVVMGLVGTAFSSLGAIRAGQQENANAKFEARQLAARAKTVEAAGQQQALQRRREADLLQSHALAVAGTSGAGTLDPDVLNIISGLDVQGERNVQTELFNTNDQANTLRSQSAMTHFAGKQAQTAGMIRGAATAFSGIGGAGMYFGMPKSMQLSQTDAMRSMTAPLQ